MDRGTYIAASNGFLQLRKLDVVNNNLSNINTPGFKRQVLVGETQTFDQTLASVTAKSDPYARGDHDRTPGVVNIRTMTDFSPGAIKNTGNPLDVALRDPNSFFVINTPQGPRYTRAGNFTLDSQGALVTADGFAVQGDGGTISVSGTNARISQDGKVRTDQGISGALQVVRFEKPEELERGEASRFAVRAGGAPPVTVTPDLVPSALEQANVSAITSVIDLMTASRGFELYSRSAQTIDQMNQSAIGQVGRRAG